MNILNQVYNDNGYNRISVIGPLMKMCRDLQPLTAEEWKQWYFDNVHSESYLNDIATDFHSKVRQYGYSESDCRKYIDDIMFDKTFMGYSKECQALGYLKKELGCEVRQAPSKWDAKYYIDFYINAPRIGIQLKPETVKEYLAEIGIQEKIQRFCNEKHARAFILYYRKDAQGLEIINKDTVKSVKQLVAEYRQRNFY